MRDAKEYMTGVIVPPVSKINKRAGNRPLKHVRNSFRVACVDLKVLLVGRV